MNYTQRRRKMPFIFIKTVNWCLLSYHLLLSFDFFLCIWDFLTFFFFRSLPRNVLGELGIRSNYGTLTVLKSPDPPKILQGDYMVTTEDREIELECVSENGKPAAEVQQQQQRKHLISIVYNKFSVVMRCDAN